MPGVSDYLGFRPLVDTQCKPPVANLLKIKKSDPTRGSDRAAFFNLAGGCQQGAYTGSRRLGSRKPVEFFILYTCFVIVMNYKAELGVFKINRDTVVDYDQVDATFVGLVAIAYFP